MKKSIKVLPFILILILLPGTIFSYGKVKSRALIDWSRGKITARGVSSIRTSPDGRPWCEETGGHISLNKGRLMAAERAREIAMEKLVTILKEVSLDNRETLEHLLKRSESTRKALSQHLYRLSRFRVEPAGYFESSCTVEISVGGLISLLPLSFPGEEFPMRVDNPIRTDYSSLIVDTRGLKVKPMLFPAVLNRRGKEVFSRLHVNIRKAGPSGMVSYVHSEKEAMEHARAGIQPYYAVALKKSDGNPVLSERDIRKIFSSPETLQQLKDCRVIFIIDRK